MASDQLYRVEHTTIDGVWNEGAFVKASEFGDLDTRRLLEVGAIRKATHEEGEAQELLRQREDEARTVSEQFDRTEAETEADVNAASTTGNMLPNSVTVDPQTAEEGGKPVTQTTRRGR